MTALYRVSLEVLREFGPASRPFDLRRLEAIAVEALSGIEGGIGGAFETRASIGGFIELAQEIARRDCGRPLPVEGESLDDHFIDWIQSDQPLGGAGFALLTALLCESLFAEGAEWVDGAVSPTGPPSHESVHRTTSAAVVRAPGAIVRRTLYDEDGYWRPVSGTRSDLEGRRLFLGNDTDALLATLETHRDDPLHALLAAEDPAPLVEHVVAHAENRYLRHEVYEHLASRGRFEDLGRLARAFIGGEDPLFIDVRADLVARGALADPGAREALLEDLLRFVKRFPRSPVAYLLLGEEYRRRAGDRDDRRARICFEEVLECVDSGELAGRARRALEALGGGGAAADEGTGGE